MRIKIFSGGCILPSLYHWISRLCQQYYSYWCHNFESDYELTHLLGQLSRLRGSIDLSWVEKWSDQYAIDRLRKLAAYYFKHEDSNHWYFFHNSFRLFLIQKTAESSPGVFDPSKNRAIHRNLAEICAKDPKTRPWSWDELYHLALAEEHKIVLERATQDWFRNQFYAFRPADAIRADIRLAMRSAIACRDLVALSRILLITNEIDDRASYLGDASFIPLLLSIGETQLAIEYLRDGNRLRVNPRDALKLCPKLASFGRFEEAKRIFSLAEPHDILFQSKPLESIHHDDNIKLLKAWAASAVYFRSLNDVIHIIGKIRREKDEIRKIDALTATHELQNSLFFSVGCTLLNEERWDDFELISNVDDLKNAEDKAAWFWLQAHAWKALANLGEMDKAANLIKRTLDTIVTSDLDSESCVFLADSVYKLLGDAQKAKDLIEKVPQPEPRIDSYVSDGLNQLYHRFRMVRLLYSLGDQRSPNEIIPDPKEDREQGMVIFERSLCILARIWADAWLGKQKDIRILKKDFLPLLHIFDRHNESPQNSVSWYSMGGAREEFCKLLANAVNLHGFKATECLRKEFEKVWNNSETSIFWPMNTRRQIILEQNRVKPNREWIINSLTSLEDRMLDDKDITERTEECIAQARAWASLNEKDQTRRILDKLLKVSFGVGYRKDYQFNIWINWLVRINEIEREKASERIEWFARAIVSMENTTEGKASWYAANDLLAVSFRWSPRRAVSLFHWFINQKVIVHEEAFCILLKEAIMADESVTRLVLYSLFDFILPIAVNAYPELSDLIIEKTANDGNNKGIEIAKYMLDKLRIYALPSIRDKWYNGIIQAIQKKGLDPNYLYRDHIPQLANSDQEASSGLLKLKDGSSLRTEEALKQVTSIDNLKILLNNESSESYFNWTPIIEHLSKDFGLEELEELISLFRDKKYSSQVFSLISKRILNLGSLENAWSTGMESLNASSPWGWDRQYDGGSRFYAFEALIQANARNGRSLLWKVFEQDLDDKSWLPQRLLFNLEKLLLLMADEPPFKEIWNEIEQYIYALFEASKLPTNDPMLLKQDPSQDTPGIAIAELLASHLNHPVNIVSQSARRACAKLLIDGNSEIQKAVQELIEKDESYQEAILMVFDAISLRSPDQMNVFSKDIQNLYQSSNYAIRRAARIIGPRIGCKEANDESKRITLGLVSLPLIYQLHIPRLLMRNSSEKFAISGSEPLPDSNDLVEIISPFDFQVGLIAKEAALPEINVCYRTIEIMRQLAPLDLWSKKGEKDLRTTLESARLLFTFQRPRPQLVLRAIYHIVTELYDAGLLDTKNLCNLDPFLRFYDPFMVLAEPMSRPNCIIPLTGLSKYGDKSGRWAEEVSKSVDSAVFKTTDGLVILAENTTLNRLAWEIPSEIRMSIVCLSEMPIDFSYDEYCTFFHQEINVLISEYSDHLVEKVPTPLIILNDSRGYDSPGDNWLALNPTVARQMGWNLAKEGLFRWVNNEGEIMVESIWWSDGFIGQHPPHYEDEVGEGWLVVASQNALSDLKSEFIDLKRIVRIARGYYKDGQQLKHYTQLESVV